MPDFFEFPPTRSNRVKWALEELEIDYASHIVDFYTGEQQSPEYRTIHPLGHVPVYSTDHYSMHESVAIVLQLMDEYSERGFSPALKTPERAEYYQWCVFSSAELDPALFDIMKHTMHLPEDQRVVEIAERALSRFAQRADMLSEVLENRDFILGSAFSGADIVLGYCCNWAAYVGQIAAHPVLLDYYARLQQRPAFKKVFDT
ncbi:MAG: glutathione S-transferase family protein [Arenicella sp.]